MVYPASGRPLDEVVLRAVGGGGVRVLAAGHLVEAVGGYLAAGPHRLDVSVLSTVDTRLALFDGRATLAAW